MRSASILRLTILAAPLLLGGPAVATEAPPATFGMDAPLLRVDRFSDAAATLLRRSRVPGLPGPGEPIHLDDPPFLVSLRGPAGGAENCYDLDVRPSTPARLYVFYDRVGNYVLGQFPVVDVAPGDPGYTDLWDVWKVIVPDGFVEDNSIRDREKVERLLRDHASEYSAERTGALVNGPIVPEGSTAKSKADRRSGAAALRYLWYRGKRAPYIYFEQTLRLHGERASVSSMTLETPAQGSSTEVLGSLPLGRSGSLRVAALPGQPDYSPLRRLLAPDGRPLLAGPVNCPIVGEAPRTSTAAE